MVRKDAMNASALCLYRKPEAVQPERPLFIDAPLSDATDEVRPCRQGLPCCQPEVYHSAMLLLERS